MQNDKTIYDAMRLEVEKLRKFLEMVKTKTPDRYGYWIAFCKHYDFLVQNLESLGYEYFPLNKFLADANTPAKQAARARFEDDFRFWWAFINL
jgi:hypothetical protein